MDLWSQNNVLMSTALIDIIVLKKHRSLVVQYPPLLGRFGHELFMYTHKEVVTLAKPQVHKIKIHALLPSWPALVF